VTPATFHPDADNMKQQSLFGDTEAARGRRRYGDVLTISENGKGVLDVDTVKGCTEGMRAYPDGGCYGECYAAKTANQYGIDFATSVDRQIYGREHRGTLTAMLRDAKASWYRIGTAGDPSHNWKHTIAVIQALRFAGKPAVIITKHWTTLHDGQIERLRELGAVVNTSTSALDTDAERTHRVGQLLRLRAAGVQSVLRVVTADFSNTDDGERMRAIQGELLALTPVIDNPLRARQHGPLAESGDLRLRRVDAAIGGGKFLSLHRPGVFLGKCKTCPDQCGVTAENKAMARKQAVLEQHELFNAKAEFQHVTSVIGSGYEAAVAKLALEDGIAQRAARKNMQIHSAIILKIDDEFAGFMTFQVNHVAREFCLLQSVIRPDRYSDTLYRRMVEAVVAQNTYGYPAIITTDPKSAFETPKLFESIGFVTYLQMSGFHYMVRGDLAAVRMKLLAHITMTNVWNSITARWLQIKREWNAKIEAAGAAAGVVDPMFATRRGGWQGANGMANVVTGHDHNGNVSVLDPTACEVILRFFMPTDGKRVYNPFGGGVQFGFVAGAYGYEYVASEIRKNQSDANNAICASLPGAAKWVQSDSSTYEPEGKFDLVFTCPPYYKVEKYVDYDGKPPPGEINSLDTYEKFRDVLFAGYRKAIAALNDDRFFVIMTGDSRDKSGAYHCSEAETVMFLKAEGLSVYNQIVYLECEFTRLAHAKKTLNRRKFPKREQKIIVAYKGDPSTIAGLFPPTGRL
jgi:hypothetical protein